MKFNLMSVIRPRNDSVIFMVMKSGERGLVEGYVFERHIRSSQSGRFVDVSEVFAWAYSPKYIEVPVFRKVRSGSTIESTDYLQTKRGTMITARKLAGTKVRAGDLIMRPVFRKLEAGEVIEQGDMVYDEINKDPVKVSRQIIGKKVTAGLFNTTTFLRQLTKKKKI